MFGLLLFVAISGWAAAEFDPDLHEKYLTMPRASFIKYFNEQNYSWTMTEYDNIRERYAPSVHLNNTDIDDIIIDVLPLDNVEFENLEIPETFDAREHWPQCETIKEVYDQEDCKSSLVIAIASALSDRTCVQKDIHVRLSAQDFACLYPGICDGLSDGYYLSDFYADWLKHGLVTQECKPYNIHELKLNLCAPECVDNGTDYYKDKHYGSEYYSMFNRVYNIRFDLFNNGPVTTTFAVYEDFYNYHRGIYEHKYGSFEGYIVVRIIGYSVEDGEKYWLIANSWGTTWGEQGLFKLKYHQNRAEFGQITNGLI